MATSAVPVPACFADVPRDPRAPVALGFALIILAVLGFGFWAAAAPIAGAVVSSGVFVATGHNKTVQHFEGGVIREILVHEGDVVQAGQTLMLLDDTAPRAELQRLALRHARALAMEARLQAEIAEAEAVAFPPELRARSREPDIATLLDSQAQTFKARRESVRSDIATLQEGIGALQEHIQGAQVQLQAVHQQLGYFEEELQAKDQLLKSGLIRRSEVLALQRARANMRGEIGRLTGDIGDTRERISRTKEQISGVRKTAVKAAVEQLQDVRAELNDVRERMRTQQGILDRVRITAPVHGAVVKLRHHTPGGVVEAGKSVMEILPLGAELILEGRVRPQDIDNVKRGQRAAVRLTALSQRVTPMVSGEVIYVSADALTDEQRGERTNADIYVVRVRLDAGEAARLPDFKPTPGMPAELYIKTAERTFLEYLFRPVKDSLSRAFREK